MPTHLPDSPYLLAARHLLSPATGEEIDATRRIVRFMVSGKEFAIWSMDLPEKAQHVCRAMALEQLFRVLGCPVEAVE